MSKALTWLDRREGGKRAVSCLAAYAHGRLRALGLGASYPLQVARYALHPAGWPDDWTLRAVGIADLHFGGAYVDEDRLGQVIDTANALRPDLVLLLGDYGASHLQGETHRAAMRTISHALRRLDAPMGMLAVLGNHDWWDDPEAQRRGGTPIAAQELRAVGIPVLENEAVRLGDGDRAVWVAGLGDQLARLGPPAAGVDDLPYLTGQLVDDAPAILLAHEPDVFPTVPDRYAVTLSGHTHGGQIKVLGRTPVVPSAYGSRYVHGHLVEDGRHLIVSAGLGVSVLPVRIGVPPELIEVTFSA